MREKKTLYRIAISAQKWLQKKALTKKEEFFRLCPLYGSTNTKPDLSIDMIVWGGITRWLCSNCGHSAVFFPDVEKSGIENFKSHIKKMTKEEQEVIKETDISKGFTHKGISFWVLVIFYLIPALIAL